MTLARKVPLPLLALGLGLSLSVAAAAQTLTGSVRNGTSNKPAAGDDVILIKLGQGMEEAARAKTDARGQFTLKMDDAGGPHLVRVIHQGVTYHRMAPPGTTSVEVEVYDVAKKLEGIVVTADVMRFQAQGNELQGIRLFAVNNTSQPPRTQMNDRNFEFYLPEGAQVDQSMAMTAGGQPVNSAPVPESEKNRYAFIFPLRPGETQFQVVFRLPYTGEANIDPRPLYGSQHFVVMVPQSMQFTPAPGTAFKSMQDPREPQAMVQVASNTEPGQSLKFKISGAGAMPESGDQAQGEAQTSGDPSAQARDSRPGGGLGPPIDAPDPLEPYRWYILSGFALVLLAGAVFIARRPRAVAPSSHAAAPMDLPQSSAATKPAAGRSALLLEALKEEMFQLELEHKQGNISQQEYEKAKAALDQTLERAVKRSGKA